MSGNTLANVGCFLTHESGREVSVNAHFAVDLDAAVHHDDLNLAAGQRVLEAVAEQHNERNRLAELVGTGRRAGSPVPAHLAQHPVLGRMQALQVFLGTASHRVQKDYLTSAGGVGGCELPNEYAITSICPARRNHR